MDNETNSKKDANMAYVLVQQQVKDYSAWKPVFDSVEGLRKSSGQTSQQLFQSADDPNHVTILLGWDSRENAQKYFTSDVLRDAMRRAGVISPTITYLNAI
jgi:heme-degrading monooxygenase HmoA